jgi:nucleotide-binding universal stress UspA family protein
MPFRSVLVHLDSDKRSDARLKFAADLARSRNARLTGLFAQIAAAHQVGIVADWPPDEYKQAAQASQAAFAAVSEGLNAEWQDLNRGNENEIVKLATDFARHFDLVVLGQPNGGATVPADFAERIIVDSGRPALVFPHSQHFADVGTRPIFAWSDAASSARGFYDGMLLVAPGAEALVIGMSKADDDQAFAYQKESLRLAVSHLAAHQIAAKPEQLQLSDMGLMDALLSRAADHGADLLAIGAFGGGGYPLFSRGSGSRYMLKRMTLPVLFSH